MKRCLMLCLILCCGAITLPAEDTLESSPWVGWRKGYEFYDRAGAFKDDNQYAKALELYTESRNYFAAIKRNFPNWNRSVVEGRIKLCENEIEAMRRIVGNAVAAPAPAPAPVPAPQIPTHRRSGGMPPVYEVNQQGDLYRVDLAVPTGAGGGQPAGGYRQPAPAGNYYSGNYNSNSMPSAGTSSGRLYIEMQSEIEQYRQRLRNALMEIDSLQLKLRQSDARSRDIDGVLRDYRLLQEKYSLLEVQYKNALARNAGGDRDRFESQIINLKLANDEAQKRIQALAGESARKDQEYAVSRNEVLKLRDDLQKKEQEVRRIQRNLELERNKENKTPELAGKLQTLENELKRKDQRIDRLMRLLSENPDGKSSASTAAETRIKQLQAELDAAKKSVAEENNLRRRIGDLTASESALKSQLAEMLDLQKVRDNEIKDARTAILKSQTELNNAAADIKNKQRQLNALESDLKTLNDRYNELEKRHQTRLKVDSLNAEKLNAARRTAEKELLDMQNKYRKQEEDIAVLQRNIKDAQALVKNSREAVIELKAKQHSSEVELRKMATLQKAYDELKARFDLFHKATNSDVLTALNRIPGLEESLKRYEKENSSLLTELKRLRSQRNAASGQNTPYSNQELEKIETLLADARSAEARDNREIAIWGYRQVLVRESNNLQANARLGRIYLKSGKFDDAAALLENAAGLAPQESRIVNDYARALIGKRNYNAALEVLHNHKKLRKGRVNAAMLLTEAVAWSRSGKNDAAEKNFKALLQLEPGNGEAAYELALMLSADEKRRKEAGEYYMLAKSNGIAVDSYLEELLRNFSGQDNATRDFLLKNAAEALGNNDIASAEWYISEVVKMYPDDEEVLLVKALAGIFSKKYDQAVKSLEKSSGDRQKIVLASALLQQGKYADAGKILQSAGKVKTLPAGDALKKLLHENALKLDGKARQLYETLLAYLP